MPKKIYGLDWLDGSNPTQLQWAVKYLSRKGISCNFPNHLVLSNLREFGRDMERSDEGRKLLKVMNEAWRKKKSTTSDNRKTYSFRLLPATKNKLNLISKSNKKTITETLEQIISNGFSEFAKLKNDLSILRNKLNIRQKDAEKEIDQHWQTLSLAIQLLEAQIADCCKMEILLRDAGIAIDSVSDEQALEAEVTAKEKIATANAAIEKKCRSLSGFHSIKSPMDRPNSEATYIRNKKTNKAKAVGTNIPSRETVTLQVKAEAEHGRCEITKKKVGAAVNREQVQADNLAGQLGSDNAAHPKSIM